MLRGGMVVDDSMSNLTSTISNEASISSSSNRNHELGGNMYSQQPLIQSFASPIGNNPTQPPPPKKKRSLPGHPDPDAEVVALSPRALMATNRFVCEICNKGFQRDQNLQLHRRGHNLPWKLKQRSNKEVVKKKVYVCPEPSCVHHDPSRALGDLTGIKKHFSRKHGEKKWKCEKCSKRYAVQSDWKAHSKICGTREYRCDCGTLFSRRDSFITHRAFCDALAEESSRSMTHPTPTPTPLINLSSQTQSQSQSQIHGGTTFINLHPINAAGLKQEHHHTFSLPPWLSPEGGGGPSSGLFSSSSSENPNPNPNPNMMNNNVCSSRSSPAAGSSSSSLMSATALLQKASQMGVTMSSKMPCQSSSTSEQSILGRPHHHVGAPGLCASSSTTTAVLPSREAAFMHGSSFPSFPIPNNNKHHHLLNVGNNCIDQQLQDINMNMNMMAAAAAFSLPNSSAGYNNNVESSFPFEDTFNGMMTHTQTQSQKRNLITTPLHDQNSHLMTAARPGGGAAGGSSGGEGLTRDFLGLRGFPHRNFLDMDGLDQMGSSSYDHPTDHNTHPPSPWQS
ncbi:protein indeterminate-domain 7-like isoform X2 [Andrographis paniculata]|uniref:protein indeterminate-domain 7-like isoform X2 n=1 Tax=Andrographis paniculata TaxID=175694 RepID=UPI0021E85BE2|nr:protein indeterminate-domain 7-like isoform X2 [Andrographis paniculata]